MFLRIYPFLLNCPACWHTTVYSILLWLFVFLWYIAYYFFTFISYFIYLSLLFLNQFSSFQSFSHVWLLLTQWTAARQASMSITNSQSLIKLMFIESVMLSNHLILCCPLLLLPPMPPSIRVFFNESVLHTRWPKYWSFSFSISPSNEYSGLISFRMYWLDILAVQRTLKCLLQHHSSNSINSSVLSFLYSPTLTSIHDYWKNHSFN